MNPPLEQNTTRAAPRLRHVVLLVVCTAMLSRVTLYGAPQGSSSYAIAASTMGAGGARSSSSSYSNHGAAGETVGVSSAIVSSASTKHGYIGQLFEAVQVQVSATPASVNEGQGTQLAATLLLEDGTTASLLAGDVSWSVVSGPLSGISGGGLAAAQHVYEDRPATVRGSYDTVEDTLDMIVRNISTDDFGIYASDGVVDDWQLQHFGEENTDGTASADPDHDGQSNRFEFTAGFDPTDRDSLFDVNFEKMANQTRITFGPSVIGRTYTVQTSESMLPGTWQPLTSFTEEVSGASRIVTDLNASDSLRFYRVAVAR